MKSVSFVILDLFIIKTKIKPILASYSLFGLFAALSALNTLGFYQELDMIQETLQELKLKLKP